MKPIRTAIDATKVALTTIGVRLYEHSDYVVERRLDHHVELRLYSPCVAAVTEGIGSEAFDRLLRYIEGGNDRAARIAMTLPVVEEGATLASEGVAADMRFLLPREVASRGAPPPADPRVRIVASPAERIATLPLSGIPRATRVAACGATLLAVLRAAHVRPVGAPSLLIYDPPWTLPSARRSEVAVRVA